MVYKNDLLLESGLICKLFKIQDKRGLVGAFFFLVLLGFFTSLEYTNKWLACMLEFEPILNLIINSVIHNFHCWWLAA